MSVSTHVLDAVHGGPAANVEVVLESSDAGMWHEQARVRTDADGRVAPLAGELPAGVYRVRFAVEEYLGETFFPEVVIVFRVKDIAEHYHVPLLLSPFAYSTYRGS